MELPLKRDRTISCENHNDTSGLNDDVLIEILTRVPAKSIIRFRSASKHWCTLISKPFFINSHTHRHHRRQPTTSFILNASDHLHYFNPTSKIFTPFSFSFDSKYTDVLQSTNGLLLLVSKPTIYGRKEYFVHNPTTRQSRNLFIDKILLCPKTKKRDLICALSLAFDPTRSPYYKVICMRMTEKNSYRSDVYDSKTHTWNSCSNFTAVGHAKFHNGIFWNNGIYWIRTSVPISFYYDLDKGSLGTLNIGSLKTPWRTRVVKKENDREGERKKYLMESNGHLHCVTVFLAHDPMDNSLQIHEMSQIDNNIGWVQMHHDFVSPHITHEFCGYVSVLGMVRGESDEESFVLFHVSEKIITYWFASGDFEILGLTKCEICKLPKLGVPLEIERKDSFQFIETLAPV